MTAASRRKPSVRDINRTEKNGNRHYYYLVAGEILFEVVAQDGSEDTIVHNRRLNAIAAADKENITESVLNQAQQALQMNLLREIDGQAEINVASVTLLAVQPLGFMTQEEFHDRKVS